ncbi:NUDIX domain-containing protein [Lachnospiraceae bacterium]|nr:NUDIX domain-containing protein [Lachnospiraceae bacterium]
MKSDFLGELKEHTLETLHFNETRKASVLIPLLYKDSDDPLNIEILFEVRNDNIVQGGEICLPGGAVEENETFEDAAVRETSEELLIYKDTIELLAPMFEISGPGGSPVRSYVGVLHDYEGTFNKDETSRVFSLPVSWFINNPPEIHHARLKLCPSDSFPFDLIPCGRDYPFSEIKRNFYFYKTPHGLIWGMTAWIIYKFIEYYSKKFAV